MGWTWDYTWNNLTVEMLGSLEREWGVEPTTDRLLAQVSYWLGCYKPSDEEKTSGSKSIPATADAMREIFPDGVIGRA